MSFLTKADTQTNFAAEHHRNQQKPFKNYNRNLSMNNSDLNFSHEKHTTMLTFDGKTNDRQCIIQSNNSCETREDNQHHSMTATNFPFSHLCNRSIRDLPLSKTSDSNFDRLRSYYILTMADLLGRYLIHRTPNEFRIFLIEKVRCSESFTDEIMELLARWTIHNLQIGHGTRTITLKQNL